MRILMITIGYPPTEVGGTEVYVAGLVDELRHAACEVEVAYVRETSGDGIDDDIKNVKVVCELRGGTRVHQVLVPRSRYRLETVVFDAATRTPIVDALRAVAAQVAPDVVHVHPLQLGLESSVMEALRAEGRNVVLTFHSSTTTCARGDLVRFGRAPCDGVIRQTACTECLFHLHGVPRPAAAVLARLPLGWYRVGHARVRSRALRKLKSFCSLPLLIEARRSCWTRTIAACDRVVAVCEWVRNVCIANGAAPSHVVLSRHGHRFSAGRPLRRTGHDVRFGYLGRLSPEKGVDVLLDAIAQIPRAVAFTCEFVSATLSVSRPSADERKVIERLARAAVSDPRIQLVRGAADEELTSRIASWDAAIVPSLWFESGPQVIYEAFAAGVPVIGSRRGGIAELVSDGTTGFLFEPGDASELAGLLARNAADPAPLRALRSRIPPVRTTANVATDMLRVYRSVVPEHVVLH